MENLNFYTGTKAQRLLRNPLLGGTRTPTTTTGDLV